MPSPLTLNVQSENACLRRARFIAFYRPWRPLPCARTTHKPARANGHFEAGSAFMKAESSRESYRESSPIYLGQRRNAGDDAGRILMAALTTMGP